MSGRKQVTITRDYKPAPDECARALGLLLQTAFNSQAIKGGPYDLTSHPTEECTRSGKKGKEMPTYLATDYEPVPPGLYTARLEKIEEATSQHGW